MSKNQTLEELKERGLTKFIFMLPIDLYDRLEKESVDRDMNKSQIVRSAISLYFENTNKTKILAQIEDLLRQVSTK